MEKQIWKPGNMLFPVPVVMVTCGDGHERSNIVTIAWAGTVCSDPVLLTISVRPERFSHQLLLQNPEFAVNLPTAELAWATDLCGVKSGRDVDKWAETGLTPAPAHAISVPIVAECPVSLECRVVERRALGSHDMFMAEVVAVDVDPRLVGESGRLELGLADLIAYVHGEYFTMGEPIGHFGYSIRKRPGSVVRTPERPGR